MKIGIPYFGSLMIPLVGFFQGLGVELVLPGTHPEEYLRLGSEFAPAEWGLPMRIQLGSYLAALEKGADLLLMLPGCLGCRDDLNRQKQKELLRQAGYDFLAVDLDLSWKGLLYALDKITSRKHKFRLITGMKRFWQKSRLVDFLEKHWAELGGCLSPYEKDCYGQILEELLREEDLRPLRWEAEALFEVAQGRRAERVLPKVGLVGDVYSLFAAEQIFGVKHLLLDRGVQVVQPFRQVDWLLGQFGVSLKQERLLSKLASGLLEDVDWGDEEGVWSQVGALVQCNQAKCSGVIQLVSCEYTGPSEEQMLTFAKELNVPFFRLNLEQIHDLDQVVVKLNAFISLLNIQRKSEENLNSAITV